MNDSDKYRGIVHGMRGEWHAEIKDPKTGKRLWLGPFNTAREAALVYDQFAMVLLGPTATFNLPECLLDQTIFENPIDLTLKVPDSIFVNITSDKATPRDLQVSENNKKVKVETLHAFHSLINSSDIHCEEKLRSEHAGSLAAKDESNGKLRSEKEIVAVRQMNQVP